ncbi:hypothetical protein QBC47DRAFT_298399 [Echria macrotheca]|uniref:Uncharacterized protein n=1 Tax=Echria macrotheca TaxID=438768 RepID=A0AAJ0FC39_9PEZI|nr:hypothetical protein QBC47DRAFT_298399 [Echria macrotheca]
MKLTHLQKLEVEESIQKLEGGVPPALKILNDVESVLVKASHIPAAFSSLLQPIKGLREMTLPRRTFIGVVGNTGAGKSSVINAVLDEESIVPTNCMRACTAVITEISYNTAIEDNKTYRAEIHFISRDDWLKELRIIFNDLEATDQFDFESTTRDSEAGIAYSKLQAVYPQLSKRDIKSGNVTPESLIENEATASVLNSVIEVASKSSKDLLEKIETYIDSGEKVMNGQERATEYWPLVKVVKIFIKASVLESGLVLVDLPGVHDSNAARAAVAAKYMEQCTGLWIVAPITRAVDDKTARDIMSGTLGKQLQLDGGHNTVSFICSKTDDISITEMLKMMPKDHEAHQLLSQQRDAESNHRKLKMGIALLDQQIRACDQEIFDIDTEIGAIGNALRRADGAPSSNIEILSPRKQANKRKARNTATTPSKRIQRADISDDGHEDSDADMDGAEARREILRDMREVSQKTMRDHKKTRKAQSRELKTVAAEIKRLKGAAKNACIRYRNEYSSPSIKQQFVDGIWELDQDLAEQRNGDDLNTGYPERDYQKLADMLPVFCVSSKAYLKKTGQLEKDEAMSGFPDVEDTGIPGLQRHALSIAGAVRGAGLKAFFNNLHNYLANLMMQIVMSDRPLKLAEDMRAREKRILEDAINKLSDDTEGVITDVFNALGADMKSSIISRMRWAAARSSEAAIRTAESWGAPRAAGGLAFMTYRATCSRDGVFKGSQGLRDFNRELCEPMMKALATHWERYFSTIEGRLQGLVSQLSMSLDVFDKVVRSRPELQKSMSYEFALIQNINAKTALKSRLPDWVSLVKKGGKEANRAFVPAVQEIMIPVYRRAAAERGEQHYLRMKLHLDSHVSNVQAIMFRQAAREVTGLLLEPLQTLEGEVRETMVNIIERADKTFSSLVEGQDIFTACEEVRNETRLVLIKADRGFEELYQKVEEEMESEVSSRIAGMKVEGASA